ncbi:tetratricopeptide repeat protein [Catenulispora yoronensis]
MTEQAEMALAVDDVVAAVNWYVRMARRYYGSAGENVQTLRPRVEAAAAAGDVEAKALLGGLLLEYDRAPEQAVQLFVEAVDGGSAAGMRGLGHLLANGLGMPADEPRAAELFRQSAELGDAVSAFNLAQCYSKGRGVRINAKSYLEWLRRAAELCHNDACAQYAEVLDRQRKPEEAWLWHIKAAELGNIPSALTVGATYRDGSPLIERDPVQAVRWFLSTLDRGISDGFREADGMAPALTAAQIREAGVLSGHEPEAQLLIDRYHAGE